MLNDRCESLPARNCISRKAKSLQNPSLFNHIIILVLRRPLSYHRCCWLLLASEQRVCFVKGNRLLSALEPSAGFDCEGWLLHCTGRFDERCSRRFVVPLEYVSSLSYSLHWTLFFFQFLKSISKHQNALDLFLLP